MYEYYREKLHVGRLWELKGYNYLKLGWQAMSFSDTLFVIHFKRCIEHSCIGEYVF